MPLTLSSYFLEGIEAVPLDIVVDGNWGRAIELDFDQSMFSFKRRKSGSRMVCAQLERNVNPTNPNSEGPEAFPSLTRRVGIRRAQPEREVL